MSREKEDLRQAGEVCPACNKSWYRRGDRCSNKACGALAPVTPDSVGTFSRAGHAPRGLGWDKKAHKVIR